MVDIENYGKPYDKEYFDCTNDDQCKLRLDNADLYCNNETGECYKQI